MGIFAGGRSLTVSRYDQKFTTWVGSFQSFWRSVPTKVLPSCASDLLAADLYWIPPYWPMISYLGSLEIFFWRAKFGGHIPGYNKFCSGGRSCLPGLPRPILLGLHPPSTPPSEYSVWASSNHCAAGKGPSAPELKTLTGKVVGAPKVVKVALKTFYMRFRASVLFGT